MTTNDATKNYCFVRTSDIEPVHCPCGQARRAFGDDVDAPASLHVVEIKQDAQAHYHQRMTEIYYILEGSGKLELDGRLIDVEVGDAVLIKPGCRHRAIGALRIINVPIPAFDPADEWFD